MTNLIERILKMEEGESDAIIYQFKDCKDMPAEFFMHGIIRRIGVPGGERQWAFHMLQPRGGIPASGSGIYGDINDVVKAAERQFGIKSDLSEWVPANYTDSNFPINLII